VPDEIRKPKFHEMIKNFHRWNFFSMFKPRSAALMIQLLLEADDHDFPPYLELTDDQLAVLAGVSRDSIYGKKRKSGKRKGGIKSILQKATYRHQPMFHFVSGKKHTPGAVWINYGAFHREAYLSENFPVDEWESEEQFSSQMQLQTATETDETSNAVGSGDCKSRNERPMQSPSATEKNGNSNVPVHTPRYSPPSLEEDDGKTFSLSLKKLRAKIFSADAAELAEFYLSHCIHSVVRQKKPVEDWILPAMAKHHIKAESIREAIERAEPHEKIGDILLSIPAYREAYEADMSKNARASPMSKGDIDSTPPGEEPYMPVTTLEDNFDAQPR